ncbi:hypothetical protein ANANG_G00042870 [Anguilla anguilla]|uniref:Ig-like domain-containing protein n=1 Tax=Anguilla anguilla TaxID=7936 RepID=A0A9D3MW76_ANGAN|nr:hypothetical protein ANANG_G00042870 [Anguilla anguilla]
MHCAFIGCCLLTLVNSASLHISQKPRFLGVKSQRSVAIHCAMQDRSTGFTAKWYKALEYHHEPTDLVDLTDRFRVRKKDNIVNGVMRVNNLQPDDSGVYFCKLNDTWWGPGSGLQVFRKVNAEQAERRSRVKDAMIFIQALLLAAVLIASLVLHLKQTSKEDAIYEEPEDNHIYEGLGIEHCGLYEDIPAVCQNSDATWDKTESPCEE